MITTQGFRRDGLQALAGATRGALKGVLAGLLAATLLAGCGGSDGDSAASAGDSNVTTGTISGFDAGNAVVVNGVAFDASSAQVVDDDDAGSSRSALKLGLEVEVRSGRVDRSGGTARALNIAFSSSLVGLVDAVDVEAGQITVIGQTVQVSDGTLFDDDIEGGLAGVTVGSILKVSGIFDASTGITTATRIDLKGAVNFFRLRGVVSALDLTARTLQIGGQPVSFANVADDKLPGTLADGAVIRAVVETAQVDGVWVAVRLKAENRFVADGANVDIDGIVTEFTSQTAFELCGLPVDASAATFTNGDALKLRAKVSVQGALVDGVLVATAVTVKERGVKNLLRLHGTVSALDTTAKTFVVNEVTVSYAGTVTFVNGVEADLLDGVTVSVKGTLATDGTTVEASRITFK
jgi:hypothetical protein